MCLGGLSVCNRNAAALLRPSYNSNLNVVRFGAFACRLLHSGGEMPLSSWMRSSRPARQGLRLCLRFKAVSL